MDSPDERYTKLVRMIMKHPMATRPVGKNGFGSSGLYTCGKLFAFLSHKRRLIVKLPAERVEELVACGEGELWDPRGSGRPLKEWFVLKPSSKMKWSPLAGEAMEFVASLKTRGHPPADYSLEHGLYMADAIIYGTAQHHSAELYNTDRYLKGLVGVARV